MIGSIILITVLEPPHGVKKEKGQEMPGKRSMIGIENI
jgi:hypothetical protein